MNNSGDAAEQMVRMSLEGVEVAAKITGSAAKEIAVLLIAALKNNGSSLKLRGRARLNSMLKSGKVLEIFSVKEKDLKSFMEGAKEYGIVYNVLRKGKNSPDGLCDIMVKADDAPKINRVIERFKFATVDKGKIESEIVTARTGKEAGMEPGAPDVSNTEKLLDDLLGTKEGKAKPEAAKTEPEKAPANPEAAKTAKTCPSEPTFENENKSARGTSSKPPSVKEELREITAARKMKEADTPKREARSLADKPKSKANTTHKQPQNNRKPKSTKSKAR
jgi:hypothetical protein